VDWLGEKEKKLDRFGYLFGQIEMGHMDEDWTHKLNT